MLDSGDYLYIDAIVIELQVMEKFKLFINA
jgi:hypothetical protein